MPSRRTNNFPESGGSLGHVTLTILAVRSAILATAWLLVKQRPPDKMQLYFALKFNVWYSQLSDVLQQECYVTVTFELKFNSLTCAQKSAFFLQNKDSTVCAWQNQTSTLRCCNVIPHWQWTSLFCRLKVVYCLKFQGTLEYIEIWIIIPFYFV